MGAEFWSFVIGKHFGENANSYSGIYLEEILKYISPLDYIFPSVTIKGGVRMESLIQNVFERNFNEYGEPVEKCVIGIGGITKITHYNTLDNNAILEDEARLRTYRISYSPGLFSVSKKEYMFAGPSRIDADDCHPKSITPK